MMPVPKGCRSTKTRARPTAMTGPSTTSSNSGGVGEALKNSAIGPCFSTTASTVSFSSLVTTTLFSSVSVTIVICPDYPACATVTVSGKALPNVLLINNRLATSGQYIGNVHSAQANKKRTLGRSPALSLARREPNNALKSSRESCLARNGTHRTVTRSLPLIHQASSSGLADHLDGRGGSGGTAARPAVRTSLRGRSVPRQPRDRPG